MRGMVAAALTALATQSAAGGLDVTGQPVSFIFNEGTVVELGFGRVSPSISGNDAFFFGGGPSGNIAESINTPYLSFKHDFTEKLSFGIMYEKPFGAEVSYGPGSFAFAGTTASANTSAITALLRYKLTDRWSIHGGVRAQQADASFLLTGGIYGPISGYTATLQRDQGFGYVMGVAFEIPEYFMRAAITYSSEIDHTFLTTERLGLFALTTPVSVTMPHSVNFEFMSGIAPKTFVFGGMRWVEWSKLQFAPPILSALSPDPLVEFDDTFTYSLGVGRQFSDSWIGLASLIYEPSTNALTTPLTPTDGFFGGALGVIYDADGFQVHGTVAVTKVGSTTPFVSALGTSISSFSSNTSVAYGVKIVKSF